MDDKTAWDIYFAGLGAMTLHPGYLKPGIPKPTLEQCAAMADAMVKLRPKGLI